MGGPALRVVALDHVGIASTGAALPLVEALGAGALVGREMPSGVVVARFGPAQALELVWPRGEATPIGRFLAQRGPGLHHVALRVEEPLERLVPGLRAHAIEPVGGVERSSDGRPSLFLHPATTGGVLVELVEGVAT